MKPGFLAHSCCTTPAAMCFWAATFVLIYGAALIARAAWPTLQPFGDTAILVALAAACLITHGDRAIAPEPHEITTAFWCACPGGQRRAAEYLLARGADLNWVGFDGLTPLDAAVRAGAEDAVSWLRAGGAKTATECR